MRIFFIRKNACQLRALPGTRGPLWGQDNFAHLTEVRGTYSPEDRLKF